MPIAENELRRMLEVVFDPADVLIKDLVGDNDHYEVTITSDKFAGLTLIKQHVMVMNALGDKLKGELHALSIKTIVR